MKKVYVSWEDTQRQVQELIRQMYLDGFKPDYIVGITRGGLTPANLISQYLNIQMHALGVQLRDSNDSMGPESNCWMSEDAYGYDHEYDDNYMQKPDKKKNIPIVDDINDSGATLSWIKNDWQSTCLPNSPRWLDIWENNVKVAVLYNNEASESTLEPSYVAERINKIESPSWIVFPWEEWWCKWHPNEEHI